MFIPVEDPKQSRRERNFLNPIKNMYQTLRLNHIGKRLHSFLPRSQMRKKMSALATVTESCNCGSSLYHKARKIKCIQIEKEVKGCLFAYMFIHIESQMGSMQKLL